MPYGVVGRVGGGGRPSRAGLLRLGAGLVALALLGALVCGPLPAAAFVTEIVLDAVQDFAPGSFVRTGLVNIPAQGISGVQLMPVGLAGDWVRDGRSLPVPVQEAAVVAYGQYIYLLGGRISGAASNRVFVLRLAADGSVAAISESTSRLPRPLLGASAFVHTGTGVPCVYVVGGAPIPSYGSWEPSNKVYRATIDPSTGALGSWQEQQALPFGLYYAALAVRGDDVYLIGGIAKWGGRLSTIGNIFHALVLPSGALSGWEEALTAGGTPSLLPGELASKGVAAAQALVYRGQAGDTIYLIGGSGSAENDPGAAYISVAYADINPDGTLGQWAFSEGSLPVPLYGHGAVLIGGEEIVLAGGRTNPAHPGAGLQDAVKAALVDPSNARFRLFDWCGGVPGCEIGAWQTGSLLEQARVFASVVAVGDWIYVIGGSDENNRPTATIFRGRVSGLGAVYAPSGIYESPALQLGGNTALRLQCEALVPEGTTLELQYSWQPQGGSWTQWQALGPAGSGQTTFAFPAPLVNAAQVRVRALFSSPYPYQVSPRIEALRLVYDAAPGDLAISLAASRSYLRPGDTVTYTVTYRNAGGVPARGAQLRLALPSGLRNLSSDWVVEGDGVFSRSLGDVAAGYIGTVRLTALVEQIPEEVTSLSVVAEGSFPPMMDLDGQMAEDPLPANNRAELALPVDPLAIVATISAEPACGGEVSPGQLLSYTFAYELSGSRSTSGVVLSVPIDASLFTAVEPLDGGRLEGSTVRWYLPGTLQPGVKGVVRLRAAVVRPLADGTPVSLSLVAQSNELPAQAVAACGHQVRATPVLALSVTADPPAGSTVRPGTEIVYTLTASNNGGTWADGAVLSAVLSQGLLPERTQPQAAASGQELRFDLGSVPVDSPIVLKIWAKSADTLLQGQALSLEAALTATGVEPVVAKVEHVVGASAGGVPGGGSPGAAPGLALSKAAQPVWVYPGQQVEFVLRAENLSALPAGPGLTLRDWVPAYMRGPNGEPSGSELAWDLAVLAGQTATERRYSAQVLQPLSEEVSAICAPAAVLSAGSLSAMSQPLCLAIQHQPNLWVSVDDGVAVAREGQDLVYEVRFGNRGGEASGVQLLLELEPGLEALENPGWRQDAERRYRWDVGSLAKGATGAVSFRARLVASLQADASRHVRCQILPIEGDADPYDNAAVDATILAGPDLAVLSLGVEPAKGAAGKWLSLSVTVANVGTEGLESGAVAPDAQEVLVAVYAKPAVSQPPAGPGDLLGGPCADAGCSAQRPAFMQSVPLSQLGPGQKVQLSFGDLLRLEAESLWDIYAQVDVGHESPWGRIREASEMNNVAEVRRYFVPSEAAWGVVYLPVVAR